MMQNCRPYLANKGECENSDEQRICPNPSKHIVFTVKLSTSNLIKESHHDENIKDDCEVYRSSRYGRIVQSAVDIEEPIACNKSWQP
jgi:hypothetical protein